VLEERSLEDKHSACLAHEGHQVVGVDALPTKVDLINKSRPPINEADNGELSEATVKAQVGSAQRAVTRKPFT
jgi:UDP-glucose 6-dehydrogenase